MIQYNCIIIVSTAIAQSNVSSCMQILSSPVQTIFVWNTNRQLMQTNKDATQSKQMASTFYLTLIWLFMSNNEQDSPPLSRCLKNKNTKLADCRLNRMHCNYKRTSSENNTTNIWRSVTNISQPKCVTNIHNM